MADNPNIQDNRDRSQVSGSEEHEVRYFAEQNGITMDQARELIRLHGNDRDTLNAEARRMKGS
jgi:hypothetical protein